MANTSKLNKILGISPHLEMIFRRVYWKNVKYLSRFNNKKKTKNNLLKNENLDFDNILNFVSSNSSYEPRLLLIHSAFAPFKGKGITPNQIIDKLIDFVGEQGTIAMPAMAKFSNALDVENYLTSNPKGQRYIYNVKESGVKTGVLPFMLHKRNDSVRSRHPINSMVALGRLANYLMEDNLLDENSLPCGVYSSWKKCIENDALIIGLGIDLTHSLTAIHVIEDEAPEEWPIENWYIEKEFEVIDGDYRKTLTLKERAPNWGALHFAERTLCKDLIQAGILKTTVIDGITVEILEAKALYRFLRERKFNGYPYFWTKGK